MSFVNKLIYASIGTAAFFLLSHPTTYEILNTFLPTKIKVDPCPSPNTRIIQVIIFAILMFSILVLLNMFAIHNKKSIWYFAKQALFATLIFYILSSTEMHTLMADITKRKDSLLKDGCPTISAKFFHSILYFIAAFGSMYILCKCV